MKRAYSEVVGNLEEVNPRKPYVVEKNVWTLRYKWKLERFEDNIKNVMKSSKFSSGLEDIQDQWIMALSGCKILTDDRVSIYLCLESLKGRSDISIKAKYTIVGTLIERCVSPTITIKSLRPGSSIDFAQTSITRSFLLDDKQHILQNGGGLEILCEIQILLDPPANSMSIMPLNYGSQLANDLAQAFNSEKYGDVTFKVGEKSFKAMKGILAARSPTLARIFDTTGENRADEITVSNINYEVFKELLFFIYTNKSPNIRMMPIRLLVAAEKYQLIHLKNMCEEVLIAKMTVENVTRLSTLAFRNKAYILKRNAIEFIRRNMQSVAQTEQFQKMKLSGNAGFMEILKAVADK